MFGMVPSNNAEIGTPVPWVSSGSTCWSELGCAVCETALVYVFEQSRTGKQFSFLIFIEECRCSPSPALPQPRNLLAPAGCCVRIISTVLFGRNEADFYTVCLILCGKKQQEHLLILFVLVAPCSRGHPAWLGRGRCLQGVSFHHLGFDIFHKWVQSWFILISPFFFFSPLRIECIYLPKMCSWLSSSSECFL